MNRLSLATGRIKPILPGGEDIEEISDASETNLGEKTDELTGATTGEITDEAVSEILTALAKEWIADILLSYGGKGFKE